MAVTSPMQPIDTTDAPFAVPPVMVLDLPAPPSVNKIRKIDWVNFGYAKRWRKVADNYVLAAKCRQVNPIRCARINRFELLIVLSESHTRQDLDNSLKCLIDYLRHVEIIADDAQCNMRRLTVEWGDAAEGCRVHIRGLA